MDENRMTRIIGKTSLWNMEPTMLKHYCPCHVQGNAQDARPNASVLPAMMLEMKELEIGDDAEVSGDRVIPDPVIELS